MLKKLKISVIIILSFFSTTIFGWWDSTHMAIAKIAEENLTPNAKKRSDELCEAGKKYFPEYSDFVTSATLADDLASAGETGWEWHGSSRFYDPDNILSESQKLKILADLDNNDAVYAIKLAIKTLKNSRESEKALALKFLIHIVGDIHMPLHCTNLYSKAFPAGDFGGNTFKLNIDLNGKNSLHALWDSCLMRDGKRLKRPLTYEGQKFLEDYKNEVTSLYPKDSIEEINIQDFDAWALESHKIGCENAYMGIKVGDIPSDEYLQKNRQIAYRQIAKAGYRLADILNEVFDDN